MRLILNAMLGFHLAANVVGDGCDITARSAVDFKFVTKLHQAC